MALFGWLWRRFVLYVLLVLALLGATLLLPRARALWEDQTVHVARLTTLQQVEAQLHAAQTDLQARLDAELRTAASAGEAQLDADIAATSAALTEATGARRSAAQKRLSLLRLDADALIADRALELRIQYLQQKLAGLERARLRLQAASGQAQAAATLAQQEALRQDLAGRLAQAGADCEHARAAYGAFRARLLVKLTAGLYGRAQGRALQAAEQSACGRRARLSLEYEAGEQVRALAAARRADAERLYRDAAAPVAARLAGASADIRAAIDAEQKAASNSLSARARRLAARIGLPRILRQALGLLLIILATPYAIRIVCYVWLAPLAERRASIRLRVPGGAGAAISLAPPSTPSVAVTLAEGEELLVRADHLQTSSTRSGKRTRWLLDWHYPLTSVFTGLWLLTRVRGAGERATVSPRHEPFSEVTILDLPDGAACVLQPRALAAVVQPIARPLRVSRHWRLFHLSSWLTMQFRYFVWHGPARLVVKGGRGVRTEPAGQGRIFGQDQMIGFSADLEYRVTRTETFWPYFLGREPLVKDRVEHGAGILLIEEVPLRNGRPARVRHGIEGMIDALMKLFGM